MVVKSGSRYFERNILGDVRVKEDGPESAVIDRSDEDGLAFRLEWRGRTPL